MAATTWTRFGDKQPKAWDAVWVIHTRKRPKPKLAEKRPGYGDPYWNYLGGMNGPSCRPDDLWALAIPPALPVEKK